VSERTNGNHRQVVVYLVSLGAVNERPIGRLDDGDTDRSRVGEGVRTRSEMIAADDDDDDDDDDI
jgi:hypothetical protein